MTKTDRPEAERKELIGDAIHSKYINCDGCGEEVYMGDCNTESAVVERWNGHIEEIHDAQVGTAIGETEED